MKRSSALLGRPVNLAERGQEGYLVEWDKFPAPTPYVSKRLVAVSNREAIWETIPNEHYPTPMLDMMKNLVGGILKPLPWVIKQGNCIFDRQQRRDFIYLAANWRERLAAANARTPKEFGEMLQEHLRKRTCPT